MSMRNTFTYDKSRQDSIYRVRVNNVTDSVEVVCIGMDCIDSPIKDGYYCSKDLPEWMIDSISVLGITTHGNAQVWVDGVGKRIDEDTYWVNAQ